jgi:RNA-binding protein
MQLNHHQKKYLRTLGHNINAVIRVAGKGLSENVMAELDRTLNVHELIKVKFNLGCRSIRQSMIKDMCEQSGATLIHSTGNVALVYRPKPDAAARKIQLSP